MSDNRTVVVAVGGNALIADDGHITIADQRQAAEESMRHVAAMVAAGWKVVITHGNGPQVGFLLRRAELAVAELPPVPLDVLGADTQGATGFMFACALERELGRLGISRPVTAVVTRTVVDAADPAFAHPTKPIGSFMTAAQARRHVSDDGWAVAEDAGRGWRRLVASPRPQRIVELEAIKALIAANQVVIAAGGGGIPVVDAGGFIGVEAVIDKDHATSLLATQLEAEVLLISTGVNGVALDFGQPAERWLRAVTLGELRGYLAQGQFSAGSMAPKIEAAIAFIERGGNRVVITDLVNMSTALDGLTGTAITAGQR
jgi:carbamate kinase